MNCKNQTRKFKNLIIQSQNHENHGIIRIHCQNIEIMNIDLLLRQNNENYEIRIIPH